MNRTGVLANWLRLSGRQAVISGSTFLGVIVFGALLQPADYAIFAAAILLATLAQSVGDLGAGGAIVARAPDAPEAGEAAGGAIAAWIVISVSTAAGVAVGTGPRWAGIVAVLGLGCAAIGVQALSSALAERESAFGRIAVVEAAQRFVLVTSAIVAVLADAPADLAVAGAFLIAAVGGALAMRPPGGLGLRPGLVRLRLPRGRFERDWLMGRLAGQMNYGVYLILVPLALTTTEAGLVMWAVMLSAFPAFGAALLGRALLPDLARAPAEHRADLYRRALAVYLPLSIPPAGAIFLAAPEIAAAFGSEWTDAVGTLRVESLASAIGVVLTPIVPYAYIALGHARARSWLWALAGLTWTLALVALAVLPPLVAISWATVTSAALISVGLFGEIARTGRDSPSRVVALWVLVWAAGLGIGSFLVADLQGMERVAVVIGLLLVQTLPGLWSARSLVRRPAPA